MKLGDETIDSIKVTSTSKNYTYKHVTNYKIKSSLKSAKLKLTANKGAKTTYTMSIKNRYLKGKSGKLTFTMSNKKTFKFNNALVVTRDANGQLGFTVVGNKKNITYSAGAYSDTTTYEKINQDANGDVVDAATGKEVKTTVTTSTATDKYKRTDIYYGYTNKFTGDYLSYSVAPTTVYVHRRESTATNAYYGYDATTGEMIIIELENTNVIYNLGAQMDYDSNHFSFKANLRICTCIQQRPKHRKTN